MLNFIARRAFVDASLCLLGTATTWRAHADELETKQIERYAASVRGPGDAGLTAWGEPWSNGCAWSTPAGLPPLEREAAVPSWLEGQWRVKSRLDSVRFPMGKQVLSESVPGVRMVRRPASIPACLVAHVLISSLVLPLVTP